MRARVLLGLLLVVTMAESAAAERAGRSKHAPLDPREALEHPHEPRHGGLFGDAEDLYHYELVCDAPNRLRLYVNDEWNRPLSTRDLHGRWEVFPGTAQAVDGVFEPASDGEYFVAALPENLPASFPIEIAVQKGSLWPTVEFEVSAVPPAGR